MDIECPTSLFGYSLFAVEKWKATPLLWAACKMIGHDPITAIIRWQTLFLISVTQKESLLQDTPRRDDQEFITRLLKRDGNLYQLLQILV